MSANQVHDPAMGLRYVANNENLYRKVLGKFADQQANAATDITLALQSGDMELAKRLVHTLKGLSASMGLPELMDLTTNADAKLKTGEDISPMLPEIRSKLDAALAAIAVYLNS